MPTTSADFRTGQQRELRGLVGQDCYESTEKEAVRYAIGHLFERKSVVDERKVYETAIRHGIGSVTPEGVQAEARRQGLLVKGGEATTREVLAEEGRVIAFAREGRGCVAPIRGNGPGEPDIADRLGVDRKLSPEQQAICRHVWDSPDRVILIRGAAGTGKTHTMKATIAGIDRPVVVLAPSADASRGVLRKEGFDEADTVARFLIDEKFQRDRPGAASSGSTRPGCWASGRCGRSSTPPSASEPASCSRATSGSTARSSAGRRCGCSRSSRGCPWPS